MMEIIKRNCGLQKMQIILLYEYDSLRLFSAPDIDVHPNGMYIDWNIVFIIPPLWILIKKIYEKYVGRINGILTFSLNRLWFYWK